MHLLILLVVLLWCAPVQAALTDSLIAYWSFDEASGNAIDAHSTHDLTETSGTIDSAAGKVGTSRDLEAGDTEYFTITDNASLSTGNIDFTAALWVNLEAGSADEVIVTKGDATGMEWQIYWDSATGQLIFSVCSGAAFANYTEIAASNLGSLVAGTWYFVVAWHDATANTINIQGNNGTANSTGYTFGSFDSGHAFTVGSTGSTAYWDGRVDELAFWKRTLTADEKTFLYNGSNGRSYAELTASGKANFRTIVTQ